MNLEGTDRSEPELLRAKIEYWKQVIYVQTHFNDMCIRTRWVGLTVNATLMAGGAVTLAQYQGARIPFFGLDLNIGAILFVVAALVSAALWQLDRLYYYKMLVTSVQHASKVEDNLSGLLDGLTKGKLITGEISEALPKSTADSYVTLLYGAMTAAPLCLAALTISPWFGAAAIIPIGLVLLWFLKRKCVAQSPA